MVFFERELDITRNIRLIEWLKSELLMDVSNLFRVMVNGYKDEINEIVSESLANIIIISYMLGRRLGLTYGAIQLKIESKLRLGIIEEHDVEKYYGDLSELTRHLGEMKKKTTE